MRNLLEMLKKWGRRKRCNYELSRTCEDMSILTQPWRARSTETPQSGCLWSPHCLLCGGASSFDLLCPACQADLPGLQHAACPVCLSRTTHGERCGACLHLPPYYDRVSALFAYDFPIDRLIQAMKYGHQLLLAEWFGNKLGQQLAEHFDCEKIDRIIPMPLHPARLRERGFNQAVELSRPLEKRLKIPVDRNLLARQRATTPQAQLALKERSGNVLGAFSCKREIPGQSVLLIDDVLTTGATANECARLLKSHGAEKVHVAVIARALKD